MSQNIRRVAPLGGSRARVLGALLAAASWSQPLAAAEVGHSRLVSGPGAPLQAVVPLRGLSAEEAASLRAAVAPEAAWQESRLSPPVPLSSLNLRIEPGPTAAQRVLRVYADRAPAEPVVDLLLDVSTSAGQRRVQVSFMAASSALPTTAAPVAGPAPAGTAAPGAGPRAGRGSVAVRRGDTLWGIAQRNGVDGATVFQMLVALWRANPDAFIQNNMNLVRAGATLVLPDAATVRAIDPQQAHRIYLQQVEAFNRGRGGRASASAGAALGAAQGGDPAAGRVDQAPAQAGLAPTAGGDRVRLSSAQDAQQDEQAAVDAATREAGGRVSQLQGNVDDLNRALGQGVSARAAAAGDTPAQAGISASPGAAQDGQQGQAGQQGLAGGQGAAGQAEQGQAEQGQAEQGQAEQGQAEQPGAAAQAGEAARSGAAGQADVVSGQAGTAAQPGAAGQAGVTGQPGAAGESGPAGQAGTPGQPGQPGGVPGLGAGPAATPGAGQAVPDPEGGTQDGASAVSWLKENLLVIVTGILAIIAFIIAWAMRRAGARRDEEELYDDEMPRPMDPAQQAAFNEKLERIDLDLDEDRRPDGRGR
ncbi:FimV/HubP family polar landmark protein [Orrella sp. JC864]|uniref:FimV/HubP family polar landmark protein n=1 Tax=Orrella sp. JC864 TaxID=3120298 RepID=UPI0030088D6F